MWLIHVNHPTQDHPLDVINAIPSDIRPYVVLNLAMSSASDDGYEVADTWLNTCAQHGMYAMMQPSSGINNSMSDTDLAPYEKLYQKYPNLIGYNFCEQAWGFNNATFAARLELYAKLLELGDQYGGYLYIPDNFSISNASWNFVAKLKTSARFRDASRIYKDHFIVGNKYTQSYGYYDNESGTFGAYLSGHAGHYAVRFDQFAWGWSGKGPVFGAETPDRYEAGANTLFSCPEAAAGVPIVEQMILNGASVIDGPEIPSIANVYKGLRTPMFNNMICDIFRKALDGTIRVPTLPEVAGRTKIGYATLSGTNTAADLYTGLYEMDGQRNLNRTWFKKTGRYPTIPELFTDASEETSLLATYVTSSQYATRWPTSQAKIDEFNALFPAEYTGDMFVARVENKWFSYNPYINTDLPASATIPLKYNSCSYLGLNYQPHTFAVVTESSNGLNVYLNNYRTDKSALWSSFPAGMGLFSASMDNYLLNSYIPSPVDTPLRDTVLQVHGATVEPTFTLIERGNHQPSTASATWENGIYTLTVRHNGPVDVTIQCNGSESGKLVAPTPVQITAPAPLPSYTVSPYTLLRAVGYAERNGITAQTCAEGGFNLTSISNGDWVMMRNVDFADGASAFLARIAGTSTGSIQVRLDAPTGPLIATCAVPATGGAQVWKTVSTAVSTAAAQGVHDLYLVFAGGAGTSLFNVNWVQFESPTSPPAAPADLVAQITASSQVLLSWSGGVGAAEYHIKRSLNSGGPYTVIASNVSETSFVDPDVNLGLTYYYVVSKVRSGFESPDSTEAQARVARTLLPIADTYVRDGGTATSNFGTQTELVVKLDTSVGLSRESFLRFDVSQLAGIESAQLRLVPVSNATDAATTFAYEFVPSDTWSETAVTWNTKPASTTPALATLTGYTVAVPVRIDVSSRAKTEAAGDGLLSLRIRSTVAGSNKVVGFASREHTDTTLRPRLEYLFPGPAAPAGVTATVADGTIALQWNAVPGATRYLVKRSWTKGGPFTIIASGLTSTSFVDTGVPEDQPVFYTVAGLNADNVGTASEEVSAVIGTAEPIVHLKFDDGAGNLAADSAGGTWPGTLVNGPTWVGGTEARINGALRLDGANDHVTLPVGVVSTLNDFTISCWVKLSSVATWARVFDFGFSASGNTMYLTPRATSSSGPVRFGMRIGGVSQVIEGTSALPAGQWVHLAVTMSGNTGTLYVNGVAVGTNTAMTFKPSGIGSTTFNYLGRSQSTADPYLNGTVDEFKIFDRALLPQEVAPLANPPPPPVIAGGSSATGVYGTPFSYTIGATNSPTSYFATGLPSGLTIDPATGMISGAPTTTGNFVVQLGAENAGGTSTALLDLSVAKAPATVDLGSLQQVYDGAPKSATATTTPPGLSVTLTYDGRVNAPVNAGSYTVVAAIDSANYAGTTTGILTIAKAPAAVSFGSLQHVYDGTAKSATVTTDPAGIPVTVTYDGSVNAPVNAGTYAVVGTIESANYIGTSTGMLTIAKAPATITLSSLTQRYDGTPKAVVVTTSPSALAVTLTYDGNSSLPIYPGAHDVSATIDEHNYTGSATGTLSITVSALVRRAPVLNGTVDGSVQLLTGESFAVNNHATLSGDLLVPGAPMLETNGNPVFAGVKIGPGAEVPSDYTITLHHGAVLRYVVKQVVPVAMPAVTAPGAPLGTRVVTINTPTDSTGDFATLRDLTLNSRAGAVAMPPGSYGSVVVNGNSTLVLGVAGATIPAEYAFESLAANADRAIRVVGPVVITFVHDITLNGSIGEATRPDWLTLQFHAGGLTVNSRATVDGSVIAPNGTVTINGSTRIRGSIVADRLVINANGTLEDRELNPAP